MGTALKISALIFILLTSPLWGATYYVCSDGNGAGGTDGSDWANCMDGFDDIGTPSAGDTLYLRDDDGVYRETLTVPSSGSEGSPITYAADTGETPVISGADVISTWAGVSGFGEAGTEEASDNFDDNNFSAGTIAWDTESGGVANANGRFEMTISNGGGDYIEEDVTDRTEYYMSYTIHIVAGYDIANTNVLNAIHIQNAVGLGVVDDSGTLKWRIAYTDDAGTTYVTDALGPTDATTHSILLHYKQDTDGGADVADDGIVQIWVDDTKIYENTAVDNDTVTATLMRLGQNWSNAGVNMTVYFDDLKIGTTGTAPVVEQWQATVTTEPNWVFFDDALGINESGTCPDDLDTDTEWCWGSNVLYQFSTSDPDTRYTTPGTEATAIDSVIVILDKDYITIDGLTVEKGGVNGIRIYGGSDNIIIQNSTFQQNWSLGINVDSTSNPDTSDDGIIQDNIITGNGNQGIGLKLETDSWLVRRNTVYSNGSRAVYGAGISVWGGYTEDSSTNHIIEYNNVYSNGGGQATSGHGIWVDQTSPGILVRYNWVYGNDQAGIFIEKTSGAEVYNNIASTNNIGIYIVGETGAENEAHDNKIFNNTVTGQTGTSGNGIRVDGDTNADAINDNLIKNNIIYDNDGYEIRASDGGENDGTMGSGNVYEYNCLGAAGGSFVDWGGVAKTTYDAWEAAYGGTTYSVESDPLLTNPSNGDFTLTSASPAIGAGIDVGLTLDYEGNLINNPPSIGAYAYDPLNNIRGVSF